MIDVPESELPRVQEVMTARLPQNWEYASHRRIPRRANAGKFLQRSPYYVNLSQLLFVVQYARCVSVHSHVNSLEQGLPVVFMTDQLHL